MKNIAAFILCAAIAAANPYGGVPPAEPVEIPIVMYHQLSELKSQWGPYILSIEEFENDIKWLYENGYETVSAARLREFAAGRESLPDKPVMLTFDDGQLSFLIYALPILERYDMRAVVNIIGSLADEYTQSGDTNRYYAYMNWGAVNELLDSGRIEIGYHSYDMHSLKPRVGISRMKGESEREYREKLNRDISKFMDEFKENTGQKTTIAAYPFGIYSELTEQILADNGFDVRFNCSERINTLEPGDEGALTRLYRYNRPHGVDSRKFFAGLGMSAAD